MVFDYDPRIDFARVRFLGRAKLCLASDNEVMRLTSREFTARYQAYKDTFDVESQMMANGVTYAQLDKRSEEMEEDWF